MKVLKSFLFTAALCACTTTAIQAQQIVYNASQIYIDSGAIITIQGGYTNATNGSVTNNGNVYVSGNWINNNASNTVFNAANGTVILNGNTQQIGGSNFTHFDNLTLKNAFAKSLNINIVVTDTLDLQDAELAAGTDTVRLTNTSPQALQRTTGSISTQLNGTFERYFASSNTYLYPLSAPGGTPYRPLNITPNNANTNYMAASFVYNNPTNDGYSTTTANAPLCFVNDNWYHILDRTLGVTTMDVQFSFDNVIDTAYTDVALWNNNAWNDQSNEVLVSNTSPALSTITVQSLFNLNSTPYALATTTLTNTITAQGNTTFCQGDSVQLLADQPHASYQWLLNGSPIGTDTSSIWVTQSGTYKLQASNGVCTVVSSDSVVVTVNPLPNAGFSGPLFLCTNDTAVTYIPNTPGGTFSGTGITPSGIFDPGSVGSGSYVITYQVTVNGCSASNSDTVQVNQAPNVSITPQSPVCENVSAFNLQGSPNGGIWSGNGITNPTTGTFDPAQAGPGSHIITYQVTSNGCTGFDTTQVVVKPTPNANFSAPSPLCVNGGSVQLTPITPGGSFSGPGTTVGGIFSPAVADTGTHTLYYQVTVNGCSNTDSLQVYVSPAPDASFQVPTSPLCTGDSSITVLPNTPGGFFIGNGITPTGIFDPGVSGSGNIQILYQITVNGCTDTDTNYIQVNQTPSVSITQPSSFCLNAAPTNLQGTPSNGTWSGNGITNPSAGTFDPGTAGVGTHAIYYQVTANGCTGTDTAQIIVNPLPDASFIAPSPLCNNGLPVQLSPNTPGGSFSGNGITNSNGTFDPAIAGAGNTTITYSVTDSNGCSNTSQQTLFVGSPPVAAFTSTINGNSVTFTDNSINASSWFWDFGDSQTSTQQNPTHTYQNSGTYTVTLIVTNSCGSDTVTFSVKTNVGIESFDENAPVIQVYPNPFNDNVTIKIKMQKNSQVNLKIYDLTGRLIHQQTDIVLQSGNNLINLGYVFEKVAIGPYFIQMQFESGQLFTHQIIKMKK